MSNPKIIPYDKRMSALGPQSVESEEAVLGSILINPEIFLDITEILQHEDFYELKHRWIFEAMEAIHGQGNDIDYLTVTDYLRNRTDKSGQSLLELVGGSAYITYLLNSTPTHLNAPTYAAIVEFAAVRRRLMQAAGEIAQLAREENAELHEIAQRAESALSQALERRVERNAVTIADAAARFYDETELKVTDPQSAVGIPTGFSDLDRMTNGLHKGEVTVVGARTGIGKTSFMLTIAANLMRAKQFNVAFFSLEMQEGPLMQRMFAIETGLDSNAIRSGRMDTAQLERLLEARIRMQDWSGFIEYTPGATVATLSRRCARLKREYGLDLIVIDYVQLMRAEGRHDNRTNEVSSITRDVKLLANSMNVPILMAAQINRNVETRSDKRPTLADLRESGSIEMDADNVLFIYRPDPDDGTYANVVRTRADVERVELIVAKQRNGPTGTIQLDFTPSLTKFTTVVSQSIDLEY